VTFEPPHGRNRRGQNPLRGNADAESCEFLDDRSAGLRRRIRDEEMWNPTPRKLLQYFGRTRHCSVALIHDSVEIDQQC
jgi:hypothetical protein